MATIIMQPLITVSGAGTLAASPTSIKMPKYAVLDMGARQDATVSVRVHSAVQVGGAGSPANPSVEIQTADLNEDDYFVTSLTTATGTTATFNNTSSVETVDTWQGDEARDNGSPSSSRRSGRFLRWKVNAATGTSTAPSIWAITFEIIVTSRGV